MHGKGGMHGGGGVHGGGACVEGEMATTAGGTRPTGMHSCLSGSVPIWNVKPSYISRAQYTVFLDDFNTIRSGLRSFSDMFVHRVSFFPDVHFKTFPK